MSRAEPHHLADDDFDALLSGVVAPGLASHLEHCSTCRQSARLDAEIVTALEALPPLLPSPDLADRVMRQVIIRRPAPPTVAAESLERTPREVAAQRRLLVAGISFGGMVTAVLGWALAFPGEALRWINPNLRQGVESLWAGLQQLPTELSSQAWHLPFADTLATPSRVVVAVGLAGVFYVGALVGFRHLLTESAHDAPA